jgi:hypothetical protein
MLIMTKMNGLYFCRKFLICYTDAGTCMWWLWVFLKRRILINVVC